MNVLRSDSYYGAFTNIGGTDFEDVIYGMSEVSGASEYSVNNAKLSFIMRIYLFKYASAVLKQLGQLR